MNEEVKRIREYEASKKREREEHDRIIAFINGETRQGMRRVLESIGFVNSMLLVLTILVFVNLVLELWIHATG